MNDALALIKVFAGYLAGKKAVTETGNDLFHWRRMHQEEKKEDAMSRIWGAFQKHLWAL